VLAAAANKLIPTNLGATPVASGGTLADGSYSYRVSATVGGVEGLACVAVSATVSGGAGAGSVQLSWTAVAGATAYQVYGRSGSLLQIVSQAGTTYTDTGSVTPSGALPTLAKNTATVATRYSNNPPKSGVTGVVQATALRGATTVYFLRFGSPAGYAQPQRS